MFRHRTAYSVELIKDLAWLSEGPMLIQAVLGSPGGNSGDPQNVVFF